MTMWITLRFHQDSDGTIYEISKWDTYWPRPTENTFCPIRVKRSKAMNMFLEVFDHWKNYMSTTANSVNIEPSYSGVRVSFAADFKYNKEKRVGNMAVTGRVQIRPIFFFFSFSGKYKAVLYFNHIAFMYNHAPWQHHTIIKIGIVCREAKQQQQNCG